MASIGSAGTRGSSTGAANSKIPLGCASASSATPKKVRSQLIPARARDADDRQRQPATSPVADRGAAALMRPMVIAAACILAATPVLAANCPPGQLYRVRLRECVMLGTPLALAAEGRIRREARRDRIRLQLANPSAPPASPQAATAPDPPTPLDIAAWQLLPLLEAAAERWAHMAAPPNLMPTAPSGPWPPLSRSEIRQ